MRAGEQRARLPAPDGVNGCLLGAACAALLSRGVLVPAMSPFQMFREALRADYDFLVTDVDTTNWRSSQAHRKAGFEVLATLGYGGAGWDVVIQDWR